METIKSHNNRVLRILYLDDDQSALDVFSLQTNRYNNDQEKDLDLYISAEYVIDHSNAISQLEKGHYDVFVCDHNMPIRQGLDLIKYLKTDYPDIVYVLQIALNSLFRQFHFSLS